jgi:TonB family protein
LQEEADRREAAERQHHRPLRRGRLFGRADPNQVLVDYAEAMARKIELNTLPEQVRELARQPHTAPMVTMAIRADGTVESVRMVRSSGVPAVDAAVERLVRSHAAYAPFPPALSDEFDVIEIRRTWVFDVAVRLY